MNRFFHREASLQLLHNIQASSYASVYDYEKHRMIIQDELANPLVYFRLPIVVPPPGAPTPQAGAAVNYVLLLVQSGSCAMGYFEDGMNLDHKVFRSYMVRKKQGKSQIKYLKTKGKSRAGSRVRLGETVEFFENINERLQQYFEENTIHRIAISCSKTLIPFLFNSKVATPFDKRDERLFKIPRHVNTPIHEEMMEVHRFLLKGELIYEEDRQEIADTLLDGTIDAWDE